MSVKLLTENHLEFPSLKADCTGSSESTLVIMPHCWKSHVAAQMLILDGESTQWQAGIQVKSRWQNDAVA